MIKILLFIFLISFYSCVSNNDSFEKDNLTNAHTKSIIDSSIEPIILDVDHLRTGKVLKSSEFLDDEYEIITLESTGSSLIGAISRVIKQGDKLYILDREVTKLVYVFSETGKYLYTVGKKGRGPEEIDEVIDFDVVEDFIYILDRVSNLSIYDLSGKLIRKLRLPMHIGHLRVFSENSIFFLLRNNDYGNKTILKQINSNLDLVSEDLNVDSDIIMNIPDPFGFSLNYENESLILNALTDTIYSVGKDKVYPKYLIKSDLGNRVLNTDIKNDIAKLERFSQRHGRVYTTFANEGALETKDNLIITLKNFDRETDKSKLGTFFYNKIANKSVFYSLFRDDKYLGGLELINPLGIIDNKIVYAVDTYTFSKNLEKIRDSKPSTKEGMAKKNKALNQYNIIERSIIEKGNRESNPFLILTKINTEIYEK